MSRPANDILPQELARLTVETLLREGRVIDSPVHPRAVLATAPALFVTLRSGDGQLRGCIGTIEPAHSNVAEEIVKTQSARRLAILGFSRSQPVNCLTSNTAWTCLYS